MVDSYYDFSLDLYCAPGSRFALKSELKERPFLFLLLIISISLVVFGFTLRLIEE